MERRQGCLIDDRCKNVILVLFEEAHEQANGNVYTALFNVMQQATVEALFTGDADYLFDDKI